MLWGCKSNPRHRTVCPPHRRIQVHHIPTVATTSYRDGEVPVTVIHRDHDDGMNKLEAARRALTEQIAAREQAEQLLQEARTTIETLETKLTHERIAKEEAVREVEDQRRRVVDELAAERAARRQAEQERDETTAGRQEAVGRPREIMAAQLAEKSATAATRATPVKGWQGWRH